MLRYILLGIFFYLLWRAVKPYVSPQPQLKAKPAPNRLGSTGPKPPPEERVGGKLAHEILGVARDAKWPDVQDAYKRLVREYHPDKAGHLAPEIRALAAERTKELNQAYEILSKRRPG